MRERRAETRMMCADMLNVYWKDSVERTRRATALLDVSHHGACLQLERELTLGTETSQGIRRFRINRFKEALMRAGKQQVDEALVPTS